MNINDEINFAYKVRHALNENLEHLPPAKTDRLAQARKAALARKKNDAPVLVTAPQRVLATSASGSFGQRLSWLGRMGVALPLLALVVGLVGVYQVEEQHRISDMAEIDAAVLSDELPLSAYLDHGFNAYLAKRGE